jgi:raffinose/stachyose/melibiose transport system substrate-binding protein
MYDCAKPTPWWRFQNKKGCIFVNFKRNWLSLSLVVAMSVTVLSACGASKNADDTSSANPSDKKAPVTLKFWGWVGEQSPQKTKFIDPAIAEFNANNQYNAKIEFLAIPQDQYNTKITTEIAANNTPDLFMTHEAGFMAPFVKSGKVHPLEESLGSDVINSFIPGIFDTVSFDGKKYAMPLTQTSQMVYYNKDIFAKYNLTPPKTMDELVKIVQTLKSNGVTPFTLANKDVWPGGLFINTMAYRHGGKQLFYDLVSGKAKFSDDMMLKSADDFSSLVKAGAFGKDANSIGIDESRQQFMSGKAAMWLMGSWEISMLTTKQQTNGTDNPIFGKVDYFNWPSVNGGVNDQNAWILAPDYNLAIAETSPNKEAAAAFMKLLVSAKYQNLLTTFSEFPATKVSIDKTKVDPLFANLIDALGKAADSVTFPDRIMGQQTLGGELSNTTQELVMGEDTKTAMTKLEKRIAPLRSK